jgi:ribosomal-protein-alanine N-acetyltransferase
MDDSVADVATPRLRLRRVTVADVRALAAISTDPRTNEHRPRGVPSRAESEEKEIVRGFIRDWGHHGIGYWVVEHLGEIIGVAGVRPVTLRERDCWNLYYRFSPASWGKGLAAEAARQAIVVAREREPARPVVARTRPGNTAAARLALAIGMVRSAELDGDGFIAYTALTAP